MTDFLRAFWGSDTGCFRQFHDTDKSLDGRNLTGSFTDLRDDMMAYASAGYGSFFIPNSGGHRDSDITRFNAVWIDLDGGKGHNWPEQWHVNPSIVTVRGWNYHAYWLLEPGTITDADTFRQVQKRLIRFYNSDKPIHNPARVMRLPDMPHMKDPANSEGYRIHHFAPDVRYSVEAVTAGLPEIAVPVVAASAGPDTFNDDALAQSYVVDYLSKRAPLAVEGQEGDTTTYAVCCAVRDFGVSEPVALNLLLTHWNDRCTPPWDVPELTRVLTHAYRYAQNSAGHKLEAVRAFEEVAGQPQTEDLIECAHIADQIETRCRMILDGIDTGNPDWDKSERFEELNQRLDITVNRENLLKIINRSFWSSAKKSVFNLRDDNLNQYAEKDAFSLLEKDQGVIWDADKAGVIEFAEFKMTNNPTLYDSVERRRVRDELRGLAHSYVLDLLKIQRQRESTQHVTDLYGDKHVVEMLPGSARVVRPFTPYKPEEPVESIRQDIVADYKQHFPQLDETLEFIAASRVSQNRKRSYLWLHADSDWGKGFFAACLSKMGASVETSMNEVKNMLQGSAVGLSEANFRNRLALVMDEVKSVNSEFKQLQDEIPVPAKHVLTATVPLYTKIIMSAENIPSLATSNGVEDQFANRISRIRAHGSLAKRALFQQVGQAEYQRHARAYVCEKLNAVISQYIEMGKHAAERKAENEINSFWHKYNLGLQCGLLSDNIADLAESFKEWCMARRMPGRGYQTVISGYKVEEGLHVLSYAPKAFDEWLRDTVDHSEMRTIGFKRTEVLELMSHDGKGAHQYRCDGKVVRGVLFKYEQAITTHQGNVVDMKKGG